MSKKGPPRCCLPCCAAAAIFLPILLIVVGEVVLPNLVLSGVHSALKQDTQASINEWLEDYDDPQWKDGTATDMIFFNLTNAYELQTVTPAPKPHFDAITIPMIQKTLKFDGYPTAGGNNYLYHSWSSWKPVNPADLDLPIVQVNPAYLGTVYAVSPSEKNLFYGLGHSILATVQQVMLGFGASTAASPSGTTLINGAEASLGAGVISGLAAPAQPSAIGMAQFGTSVFMNLATSQSGYTSVAVDATIQGLGVCTPIELAQYLNDVTTGPFAAGGSLALLLAAMGLQFDSFTMTITEATAFFAVYTDGTGPFPPGAPNWIVPLSQAAAAYGVAAVAGDSTTMTSMAATLYGTTGSGAVFAPAYGTLNVQPLGGGAPSSVCTSASGGVACPILAAAYATYLTSHLPEKFFIGCNLLGCANNECLLGDGTSPVGSGLFVRHSVAEMLHGYADPLFAAVPASAVPPGVVLEYNGILGQHQTSTSTLATLRAAIAANSTTAVEWAYEYDSGKADITNVNKWVSLKGDATMYINQVDGYPGWGTTGIAGDPFVLPGLRSQDNQAPQTATNRAFSMMAGANKAPANFGTTIEFYLASLHRAVTVECADDCGYHDVKGVNALKYSAPLSLLDLTVNGTASTTCGGTSSFHYATSPGSKVGTPVASTCDYMMRHAGVINLESARGAPAAVTMGYLGNTGTLIRDAVSITLPGSTTEIVYDQATDELALFFEPISGRAIKGLERLQTNFYIEKTMLDSTRYENIFSGTTDNGDVFVWPYLYLNRQPGLSQDQADTFVATIYRAYLYGGLLDIGAILSFVIFGGVTLYLCKQGSNKSTGLVSTPRV